MNELIPPRSSLNVLRHRFGLARNVMQAFFSREIIFRHAILACRYPEQVKAVPFRLRRGMLVVCPDTIDEMLQMDRPNPNSGVNHERA